MLLVVDANVVLSALTGGRITDLLFSPKLELVAPDLLFREVRKHKEEIREKSKLPDADFEVLFSLIEKRVKTAPIVALALKLSCPFWTYEKRFGRIGGFTAVTTADVFRMIEPA